VGDVDPLGALERPGVVAGDVGVMALEQGSPGDLDRLGRRVRRQLEAGIEVVVGDRAG
jgi:hypothetical protein